MVTGVVDIIAPRSIVIPTHDATQEKISGAIWMSGGKLIVWSGNTTAVVGDQAA